MSRRSTTPPPNPAYLSAIGGRNSGFFSVPKPGSTAEGSYEDGDGDDATTEVTATEEQAYGEARNQSVENAPPSYRSQTSAAAPRGSGPRALGPPPPHPPTSKSTPPPAPRPIAKHASPFELPVAPSDVSYHWTDDASTIAPEDSVSQLGRNFTGRKKVGGPRPLPPSAVSRLASTPEEERERAGSDVGGLSWVPPEALGEEERSYAGAGAPTGVAEVRGPGGGDKVEAYRRGGAGGAQEYYPAEQYAEDEHEEYVDPFATGRERDRSRSSAALPLVAGATPIAGFAEERDRSASAGVTPYRAATGYAAVGAHDDDADGGYSSYARRSVEREREKVMRVGYDNDDEDDRELAGKGFGGASPFSAAFAAPLAYVKSFRSPSSTLNKSSLNYEPDDDGERGAGSYPPVSFGVRAGKGDDEDVSRIQVAPLWQRLVWDTTPNAKRVDEHKRGLGVQARPWACWTLSAVMVAVLIYELVKMANYTGSPIQTKPSFNVMIGPSGAVMINLGARFAGCTKFIPNVSDIEWVCLPYTNLATVTAAQATCTMSDICGFGGFPKATPNQSFRFFLPIFLHAGIVHLALNLLAQCIERQMGTPKFLILYFAAGIFGFVLGSNFALVGQPSVGASGAIFGTHAAILVDLLAHWKIEYRPVRKLCYLLLEIVVGLALGLVPGIDNFAHLGGFLMGLLVSILLFPTIHQSARHRMVFIVLRCIAAPLVIILFVVLVRNFYVSDPAAACEWCRFLSCWPTSSNNHCKGTGLQTITSNSISLSTLISVLLSTFVVPLL